MKTNGLLCAFIFLKFSSSLCKPQATPKHRHLHHVLDHNLQGSHTGFVDYGAVTSFAEVVYEGWRLQAIYISAGIIIVVDLLLLGFTFWQTGKLFSHGLWSKKLFKGGGCWMIVAALCGIIFGSCLGYMISIPLIPLMAMGFMLLGVAFILVGRRGAILGGIAGIQIGLAFGSINFSSIGAIITEGVLCSFAGICIGFIPIFPDMRINARYIQLGLR
ncbi:hypothetical protein BEWA_024250 [Theileria equi strain WA]|uniref:Signal peptide containing protein n=1 Tax=Theileria equi strain WA TaxID=1537102 RepID=L0AX25_THEEQ|nr:hypothetical protein BEWA_024250 [Theileria equi strain WA]AFZ79576.1 hypothetical protein BEWA_024250 [Theileria equi strain WA]|eukprot:XP_004829242.1 hypothetical protein BEWA_024250 [Theileria equi strain WA]